MIEVKIVADSLNPCGIRLVTFQCKYHRFIHSELMTHRAFSRNAASSRAIPVKTIISTIRATPAIPVYWGKNQKGMQADDFLSEADALKAEAIWLESMESQIGFVERLIELNVHKQIANRLLEPFFHITTLITSTEFGNFFNLRAHKDAQPEFQELAFQMLEAYESSCPKELAAGQWHLPYADKYMPEGLSTDNLIKIATARAARVSYVNFEGDICHEKDYELHDSLLTSGHWSPFEHPARAEDNTKFSGNIRGYTQYRKTFTTENRTEFDAATLKARRKHHAKKNHLGEVGRPISGIR